MVKKITQNVDNLSPSQGKCYQLILQIQEYNKEGCSNREIARRLGIGRNTVKKYLHGDPVELCKSRMLQSQLDAYIDIIYKCLNEGYSKSATAKYLYSIGYDGGKTNIFNYLTKIERMTKRNFAPQPYIRTYTEAKKYGSKGKDKEFITRASIFRYLWMDEDYLSDSHINYIMKEHPILWELKSCIREFHNIFRKHNMPQLYLFLDKYSESTIPEIKSFVKGMIRDIDAVENAVASDLSNGFVEGTNSKLKMVKRTMYGRGSHKLLTAKLMLSYMITDN